MDSGMQHAVMADLLRSASAALNEFLGTEGGRCGWGNDVTPQIPHREGIGFPAIGDDAHGPLPET